MKRRAGPSSRATVAIFQETLTNIVRHANATRVRIRLQVRRGNNPGSAGHGKGLTARDLSGAKSLGLLGMRERAMMLDGEVTIVGRRGKGTKVVLRIPLAKPSKPPTPDCTCVS